MTEPRLRQIGKYQIQAELGRGGFGSVYRAYDPTVGRLVAIKVLTASGDRNLLSRFKNEAAAAGNLRHKNIVTIYDFGEHEGLPYIVMEFLEGEDLQQVISQRKPLTLLQKVSIMLQVADGLHCAHRSGVVHRDVKPGNIRLLSDGAVKIMDFGIARLVAGGAGGARITRQGHVIGTLLYMAPEQVRGGEVDFLCDIFAFGITYYELLTGTHPFQGSDPRTIFYRITSEDPEPIRNLVPECPEALEEILNRTLHKERELRYQSLREVQLDTEPLLIELRQERATRLLSEANRLYAGGQLDSAQAVLSEAFDLDPGNREARQLRETIQSKLLRRVIEPKIEALLKTAERQIAERQFQEAIASYEAALRLDRDNAEIKDQLDRARQLLNISRESARVVAEARREFSRNNLEATLQTLPEMLELDPGNPDARQLLQEVREELKRRERETLYEKKMLRAKELLQANRFDEALRELNSLEEGDSGREEAAKLSAQIKEKKLARERQQKYNEELASARELLTAGQYETAIPRLERLMNKYPEEPEATKLFIAAHKKLAAQRKGEALQNLGTELAHLVEARQFDRALEAVNEALREYPAEQRLLDALREIEAEQESYRHAEAIRELVEKAQENVAQGLPEAAAEMLEAAIATHPREERLTRELAAVRILVARKQRDQAIDALCREADGQLERQEFDRAVSAIGEGLRTHGEDARLADARVKIVHAKSQWERSEAVRHALETSAQSLAAHDPDRAVAALEAASGRYPDDSQLLDALARARDAAAEKQREDAIEQICREADGRLQDREFDKALAFVEQALQSFADEGRLKHLRDRIVSARAEWERAETIRQVLEDLANDNPERAVQALDAALKRYPRDEQLSAAEMQARQALSRKQREQAIEIALRQASSDSANQEFDRATAVVDQAIDSHGTDARLTALRDRIVHAKADWEQDEHVSKALRDSEQRLSAGDPADAIEMLEAAIERYPHEERLSLAVAEARRTLWSLRRETAIQELCSDLSAQLEQGEFDRALEGIQRGAESFGEDHRLTEFRRRIVSARDEWRRAEAVRSALEQSTRYLSEGDPEAALQTLETALAQLGREPQLEAARDATKQALETKRRESAIEAVCLEAVSKLDRREFDRAIAALDQAIEANGPDERFTALLDRVSAAKGAWEREEAIQQAVAESTKRLSLGDPDGALAVAQAVLAQYPDVEELVSSAASAREALEKKRRDAAIEDVCRSAGEKTEGREFDEVLDEIAHGIAEYGSDERLVLLQQKTAAAKADWQRQEDIRAVLQECEQSVAKGEPEAALRLLEKALREYPEEASLAAAVSSAQQALDTRNRARAIQRAATNVRRLLKNRQLDKALLAVEQELGRYPDDSALTGLRDQVVAAAEERSREKNVRQALSRAAELQGRNRVEDALQALRQALEKYPGEPRLSTAYREIERESTAEIQQASLRATPEQAQQLLEQDADEAARSLEAALAERQSRQRDASIDAVCLETQRFVESREFAPALDTIERAVQALGGEQRLAQMRETVLASKADFERAEGIRQAVEEAGRYGAQGQLETAVHSLLTATQIFGPADQLTEALTATKTAIERKQRQEEIERLCRQAQAEVDAQRLDNASRLLSEAEQLHGPASEFASLHRNLDAAKAAWQRAEAVSQAIQEINGLIAQGALDQAVQAGDAALARFPGEPEMAAIRARAVQARKAKRRDDAIERVCDESRATLNRGDFKAALKMINQGQKTQGADPRFEQLRTEVAAGKVAAERRNSAARLAAPIVPAPGPQKNPWGLRIAAGIVLTIAAAGLWLSGFGRTGKTVRLQVKASPSNANVKVESQTCTKGDCSFDLKPGVYQVQISADGYQSRTEEARLTLGTAAPEMSVALKPLTPTLQVAANFVQGQVSLDGRTIGRLLDGQFAIENLQPGKHELRISGSDYAATVTFETEFAKVPVLGGISADGVDAIALGSFASEAAVSCSGCSGMSFVDGLPRREIKNGVLTLDSLSAGTHQLRLNSDSGERSMVFVAGGAPSVNLALTSNRNYGTLVVDTGEDGVSVFIDGQRYSRTTARGQVRTPVVAKEHTVRVVKDGLRAEPAEFHGSVPKGGQLEARFKLTWVPARLLVANGTPGASVGVDGRVVGTVASDGSFSTQVPPGKHQIEFAREGFTASQIPMDFSAGRTVQLSAEAQLTPAPQSKASTKAAPKAAPAEPPRPDPAAGDLADWQRVVRNPSVADVEEFLQKHPAGANAPEAQRLLERLEWNATNRNSKTALQQFLSRHAEGAHAQEAKSLLASIEKLEADELAAAQRAKEQATRTSNDVQAVAGVLKTFEDAYNRRDLGELKRLWNPMPKTTVDTFRNQFRDAKTLAFHIKPTGAPSLNGDTATAICIRTLSFTARSGERPPETNERVRITLERTGSTWAIRSITPF